MADIPLNYFVRLATPFTNTLSSVYTAPFDRASIILAAYVTNSTSSDYSIQVGVSGVGNPASFVDPKPYFDIVGPNFLVPAYDTLNIVPNKMVLQQYDTLIIKTTTPSPQDLKLNLSILETVNTVN